MIEQLRIHEIFERNRAAVHARFEQHAMRINRPDIQAKETAWRRFLADKEWAEIKRITKPEHGDLVGEVEDHVLRPTQYSPATILRGAPSS